MQKARDPKSIWTFALELPYCKVYGTRSLQIRLRRDDVPAQGRAPKSGCSHQPRHSLAFNPDPMVIREFRVNVRRSIDALERR